MSGGHVKDLVSISIHGLQSKVATSAKIWIGEFWSMKLVKVRTAHFFIMFDTHHECHAHLTVTLCTSSLEFRVVNLTVLLLFLHWTCYNFHLNCYFLYDWNWRTFVKTFSVHRICPFPKQTFQVPSIAMWIRDEDRHTLPFPSGLGLQIETHVTMPTFLALIKCAVRSVLSEWFSLSVSEVIFQDFTQPPFRARLCSEA